MVSIGGTSHGKVRTQYPNTNIDRIQVCYSIKRSGSLFSCANVITRFCLSFVLWSFQVLGEVLMDKEIESGKRSSLGMPKAPQEIQGFRKILSLGMPREGIPSLVFKSIGNVTWGYIFIHHMLCVLLGASCIVGVFYFCCVTIFLAAHLDRETCTHRDFVELHLYLLVDNSAHICFTYIFWAR